VLGKLRSVDSPGKRTILEVKKKEMVVTEELGEPEVGNEGERSDEGARHDVGEAAGAGVEEGFRVDRDKQARGGYEEASRSEGRLKGRAGKTWESGRRRFTHVLKAFGVELSHNWVGAGSSG